MEMEKKLALLQNTYAAAIAEAASNYARLGALEQIVENKRERQPQTAPYMIKQLGIESVADVFSKLADLFGCANWQVKKTPEGYIATATTCKLCALAKRMGDANPCHGWCLDPMTAMISAVSSGEISDADITVESTLFSGDCCRVILRDGSRIRSACEPATTDHR